jgi:hypothetical protein
MTTTAMRNARISRRTDFDFDFRKEPHMHHIELRLTDIGERQALFRSIRDADRVAERRTRSLRRRVGLSLVRLGERLSGDASTTPAWQG